MRNVMSREFLCVGVFVRENFMCVCKKEMRDMKETNKTERCQNEKKHALTAEAYDAPATQFAKCHSSDAHLQL
jgi:hypothetical protein